MVDKIYNSSLGCDLVLVDYNSDDYFGFEDDYYLYKCTINYFQGYDTEIFFGFDIFTVDNAKTEDDIINSIHGFFKDAYTSLALLGCDLSRTYFTFAERYCFWFYDDFILYDDITAYDEKTKDELEAMASKIKIEKIYFTYPPVYMDVVFSYAGNQWHVGYKDNKIIDEW